MDLYEKAWAGKHGKEYTERCDVTSESRVDIFYELIRNCAGIEYSEMGILEVGCNKGHNLTAISRAFQVAYKTTGIEINKSLCTQPNIINGSAYDLPWSDNVFDLVFTAGVLIHIPPVRLQDTLYEMRRVSNKYVLMIEYFSEKIVGRKYEEDFNHQDGVWSRPYGDIYKTQFPKDNLIKHGKISDLGDDGWDFSKCDYWIFEKNA